MTHDALVTKIREVSEALGIKPRELSQAKFRIAVQAPGVGSRGWAKAKEEASGGEAEAPPLEAVPPGHRVKGISTLVGPDGETRIQWVKTTTDPESREEVVARLLADLPRTVPVREGKVPGPREALRSDLLAVYPIGDPHIGMLAWKHETGASFDLDIAETLMVAAIQDLVVRGPRTERAIVAPLGDTFHFDNARHETTRGGHTLDVDGRTAKVLRVGMRIIVATVDAALAHHGHVTVDPQAGNHDGYTAIMLAIGLDAHYRNEPRVTVVVDPALRHYHRFGRVLIGTVHGDRTKADDLPSIMAAERPEDWGQTRARYWLCGHVHHSSVKEYRGVLVETFRTLAARDSWHAGQGYLSGRDMCRITYHHSYGEIGREVASVDYLQGGTLGGAHP